MTTQTAKSLLGDMKLLETLLNEVKSEEGRVDIASLANQLRRDLVYFKINGGFQTISSDFKEAVKIYNERIVPQIIDYTDLSDTINPL